MKRIGSNSPFEEYIGFSRAVKTKYQIAISGTAPIGDNNKIVGIDDVYEQTKKCFEISKKAVEDVGGNWNNVFRTRIFLTDISRWKEAAKAHGEIFHSIRPVCTFMEVSRFIDPDWLVETEVDCGL